MALLHSDIQHHLGKLREEPGSGRNVRHGVLTSLVMHADGNMRCFPGIRWIAKESGCQPGAAGSATEWLFRRKAIVAVPYDKRLPKEQHLEPHKYVFQLTGIIEINGQIIPTTFMSADQKANTVNHLRDLGCSELAALLENVEGNVYAGKIEIDPATLPEDIDIGMDIDLGDDFRCDFEAFRGEDSLSEHSGNEYSDSDTESLLIPQSLLPAVPSGSQATAGAGTPLTRKQIRQQQYAAQGKKVAADDEKQKATLKTKGAAVSELVLLVKETVAGGNLPQKYLYRLTDKYSKRGEDGVTRNADSPEFLYATNPLFKAYVQRVIAQAKVLSKRNGDAPIEAKMLCGTIANYERDSKTTPGWFQFQSTTDPNTVSPTAEPQITVEQEMTQQHGAKWILKRDISPAPKGYEWAERGMPGNRVPQWIKAE